MGLSLEPPSFRKRNESVNIMIYIYNGYPESAKQNECSIISNKNIDVNVHTTSLDYMGVLFDGILALVAVFPALYKLYKMFPVNWLNLLSANIDMLNCNDSITCAVNLKNRTDMTFIIKSVVLKFYNNNKQCILSLQFEYKNISRDRSNDLTIKPYQNIQICAVPCMYSAVSTNNHFGCLQADKDYIKNIIKKQKIEKIIVILNTDIQQFKFRMNKKNCENTLNVLKQFTPRI